jgi:hypothetical protein
MEIELGGFEAFAMYQGLKFHFNGNYDYVKYNGKTKVSKEQFSRRRDKYSFYRLSRKYKKEELLEFYISNFLHDTKIWIFDLLTEESDERYKKWLKKQQSLAYMFKEDLNFLFDNVDNPEELLRVVDGEYPLLYTLHLQGKIQIETIIIMNDFLNFMPMWSKKVSDDIIFPHFVLKCEKYSSFLNYDEVKFKSILKDNVCQTQAVM